MGTVPRRVRHVGHHCHPGVVERLREKARHCVMTGRGIRRMREKRQRGAERDQTYALYRLNLLYSGRFDRSLLHYQLGRSLDPPP
jgi:hypothetical protein